MKGYSGNPARYPPLATKRQIDTQILRCPEFRWNRWKILQKGGLHPSNINDRAARRLTSPFPAPLTILRSQHSYYWNREQSHQTSPSPITRRNEFLSIGDTHFVKHWVCRDSALGSSAANHEEHIPFISRACKFDSSIFLNCQDLLLALSEWFRQASSCFVVVTLW
jgi:hypothetical protein